MQRVGEATQKDADASPSSDINPTGKTLSQDLEGQVDIDLDEFLKIIKKALNKII